MSAQPFLLDGSPVTTTETAEVRNPYNGAPVAEICVAGEREVFHALDIAEKTFAVTRHMPVIERSRLLRKISDALGRRADEFVEFLVAEAGKPVTLAKAEVQRAQSTFELAAAAALESNGHPIEMEATPAGAGHVGMARRFPLGVILGITPFNFPLNLVAHKVAPCLATGNTMILKPAMKTPLCALLLGDVLAECGAPAGQVAILPFGHEHVGALLRDARVKMLSFTGGVEVGWKLKGEAIKQKVTLELGGNAGCLVEADSDWRKHAAKMAVGAFAYAGQSCISVQRIFAQEPIYSEFKDVFLEAVQNKAVAGDPRDAKTLVGPMITKAALDNVVGWIKEAEARGAKLLTPLKIEGQVMHPVVLENVPRDAAISCEEAFAPVVVLESYKSFEDGLASVNDSKFGLQAGVFTPDLAKAHQAFDTLDVGGVLINQVPTFRTENMPYGGVKDSGFGREGVRYAMEDMTEIKSLVINERGA
ncbi:MAG: Succinate semialdehyde dehydrogenase [Verrucomicrobiota bacterium]|jgi:glyceraldehyde-3-phosphate dehydrogenase (NADP+)